MKGYKGFNKDFTCLKKQYEENTDYEENGDDICKQGVMHFCKNPWDVLDNYPLVDDNGNFSEFAEVEADGNIFEKENKCAATKLHIGAKLGLKGFIKACVNFTLEKTKYNADSKEDLLNDNECDSAQIGSSGDSAKIGSSGDSAKIGSSGDSAQIGSSGDYAQIGSSGDSAKIGSSGDPHRLAVVEIPHRLAVVEIPHRLYRKVKILLLWLPDIILLQRQRLVVGLLLLNGFKQTKDTKTEILFGFPN